MTAEQHNAEMITLHKNLMECQAKVKKDIRFLTEKRDLLLTKSGGIDKMNDTERRNYDMFHNLIEHAQTHLSISQAIISKYQDLVSKQAVFISKYQTPFVRMEFIKHLNEGLTGYIENELQKFQTKTILILNQKLNKQ